MLVSFMDLLGFSHLLKNNEETAVDNLTVFNETIKERIIDRYVIESQNEKIDSFIEKYSTTTFNYMISVSDSLIIGSKDSPDLFISQLANYVSSTFMSSSKFFRKAFSDINKVENRDWVSVEFGMPRYHKAFPILFRGGISAGDQVCFFPEYFISNSDIKRQALNVTGATYLKAVDLEKAGKGPRLFCDSSVVDMLSNKSMIRKVDSQKNIYEIIWTIEGCEASDKSSDPWNNAQKRVDETLLLPAIHLYNYYKNIEELATHYCCLLDVVCWGIIKYVNDKLGNEKCNHIIEKINKSLIKNGINITYSKSCLDDFWE